MLLLLAGLLLPSLASAKKMVSQINCINNLKQIGTAVRLWAGDHNDRFPDQVPVSEGGLARTNATRIRAMDAFRYFQVMSNELNTPKILLCPADKARKDACGTNFNFQSEGPNAFFTNNRVVSYFVGVGAADDRPRMLLSGDRNIYGPTTTPDSNGGYGNSP
jgi:hypothetical protein